MVRDIHTFLARSGSKQSHAARKQWPVSFTPFPFVGSILCPQLQLWGILGTCTDGQGKGAAGAAHG